MRGQIRRFIQSGDMKQIHYWGGDNRLRFKDRATGDPKMEPESRMYKLVLIKTDLSGDLGSIPFPYELKHLMMGYYKLEVELYTYDGDFGAEEVFKTIANYTLTHLDYSEEPTEKNGFNYNISFADIISHEIWSEYIDCPKHKDISNGKLLKQAEYAECRKKVLDGIGLDLEDAPIVDDTLRRAKRVLDITTRDRSLYGGPNEAIKKIEDLKVQQDALAKLGKITDEHRIETAFEQLENIRKEAEAEAEAEANKYKSYNISSYFKKQPKHRCIASTQWSDYERRKF